MSTVTPTRTESRPSTFVPDSTLEKIGAAKPTDVQEDGPKRDHLTIGVVGWLGLAHLGCFAAPFFFTWEALALTVFMHWAMGSIGICLGFHRLLTHSSFKTYPVVKWFFAFVGGLAGEGSAISWIADHRKHHAYSDHDGDPHTPHDGGMWSHMLWLAWGYSPEDHQKHIERWAPDLNRDPVMRFLHKSFLATNLGLGVVFFSLGYWLGGSHMAWSFVVWGMFVRLVLVLHTTWFVNSASHMWGYRNYETTDDSRNLWWVGLLAYGEGWHNNHHAYPRMAPHGHKWWEIDMTYGVIRLMRMVGLAWDVVDYKTAADKKS